MQSSAARTAFRAARIAGANAAANASCAKGFPRARSPRHVIRLFGFEGIETFWVGILLFKL